MPAPRHIRVTFTGALGSASVPVEEFSMGLSLIATPLGVYRPESMQALAEELLPLWGMHIAAGVNNQARLTGVRAALVGDDGKYERTEAGAYVMGDAVGDIPGTGTNPQPMQLALAVTMYSAFEGTVGRGRFFLPSPSLGQLGLDGRMSEATRDAHVTRAQAFLQAVNTAAQSGGGGSWGEPDGPIGVVCVASGGSATKGLAPALRPVLEVGVGRVPDTQRRRRGDLPEDTVRAAV